MARVEIGGSTGRKRAMPRFVTPFKGGKRPKGDDQEDPASPLRGQVNGGQTLSTPATMANRHYPPTSRTPSRTQASTSSSSAGPSVFNLSASVPRQKLSIFGRPETVSSLQMIARGVPDEVLVILATPSRAAQYAFESATGTLLQPPNALTELLARAAHPQPSPGFNITGLSYCGSSLLSFVSTLLLRRSGGAGRNSFTNCSTAMRGKCIAPKDPA